MVSIGRNVDAGFNLAVDLHWHLDLIIYQVFLLKRGEWLVGDGLIVAKALPQFLRNVRGDGGDQLGDGLHRRARCLGAVGLGQVVDVFDELGHHRVQAQVLIIIAHARDGAVQLLQVILGELGIGSCHFTGVLIDGQAPQALQEALRTDDVLGRPRAGGIQRAHGHLVHAQGIGAEVAADIVRGHGIFQGLAHLAVFLVDLFAVVVELAVLFLYLGRRDIYAAGIGIGVGLNIALVVQAAIRLLRADKAQVKEHLVPEAGVEQVQHGVLDAADVQIHTTRIVFTVLVWARAGPVALVFDIAEGLAIAGIDIAQLVPGRTRPLGHNVGIAVIGLRAIA